MKLKREISKVNLLFISITSIIGSGWLFGSFYTAQMAGPSAIISWFLGGIFIAFIALPIAELSTMFPFSGGSTTYATLCHGKFCGALFSWLTWLWSMAVAPIEVQAVMQYSSHYVHGILNPLTHALTPQGFCIAASLIFILSSLNLIGIKFMTDANKFISVWKIIIPLTVAIVLLTYHPHWENLTSHSFAPNGVEGLFSAISTGGVALSFFGFQTGVFLAGEAKNPQKSIPFALFGSLLVCTIIYGLLQFGFIVGVQPTALAQGWSHVSFANDSGPFAGILLSMGLVALANLLYADAIVSPLGTGFGYAAASSRVLYSMGLHNEAPAFVAKLNRFSTPWISIGINFVFGLLFFLPFSNWQQMASFLSAAIVVSLVCGPVTLPIFRDHLAEKYRPFILPFGKVFSFISLYICSLVLVWTGFQTIAKFELCFAGIFFLVSLIYFFDRKNTSMGEFRWRSALWIVFYLVLIVAVAYCGPFGGGRGWLNMGTSLVTIFLLCGLVLYVARKTALSTNEMRHLYVELLIRHKEEPHERDFLFEGETKALPPLV